MKGPRLDVAASMKSTNRPARLINVQTLRLELVEGPKLSAPGEGGDYAILSHTWGSEEITFSEWQDGTAKDKAGYGKIVGACRLAEKEGLEYVWVDIRYFVRPSGLYFVDELSLPFFKLC
jgi:hypothetical protein